MELTFKAAWVKDRTFYELFDDNDPRTPARYFSSFKEAFSQRKTIKHWAIRKVRNSNTLQRWDHWDIVRRRSKKQANPHRIQYA
jgi:hypothetical protein